MSCDKTDFRIVFVNTRLYGNQYAIEQRKEKWWGGYGWRQTHLCNTLEEARMLINYLSTLPKEGEVVETYVS